MKLIKIEAELLTFDDGTTVEYYHNQDCCENVYADFEQLKDTNILTREFKKIKIEGVEGSGFRLNGYFIPCYNQQNGYYGSDLSLLIKHKDGSKEEIDISNFVEDDIN